MSIGNIEMLRQRIEQYFEQMEEEEFGEDLEDSRIRENKKIKSLQACI